MSFQRIRYVDAKRRINARPISRFRRIANEKDGLRDRPKQRERVLEDRPRDRPTVMSESRSSLESVNRIEPTHLERTPESIADVVAEISGTTATLDAALHPTTVANLANIARIMNSYYSNFIEGNDTRPRDIERALAGQLGGSEHDRDLQREAAAHVRVQATIDELAVHEKIDEPGSREFVMWLHRRFYKGVPIAILRLKRPSGAIVMKPGAFRAMAADDVAVGRHLPPSSSRVNAFMQHFESRYWFSDLGKAARIVAMAAAHHRLNYIHPFPDGNGRVSRFMSHAMVHRAHIGAHGLWSVSRGLARGLTSRNDYMRMMNLADTPRQGALGVAVISYKRPSKSSFFGSCASVFIKSDL